MSKQACKHRVFPEDGCRICELETQLAAARKALEEFDRLSSLGTMLSKPGGPDAEGISRLFAMGNQLKVLRKLLGVSSQAQPAPRAECECASTASPVVGGICQGCLKPAPRASAQPAREASHEGSKS